MKKRMALLTRLFLASTVVALISCSTLSSRRPDESQIVSARVGGVPLTGDQVAVLNSWLAGHRSGWGPLLFTPFGGSFAVTVRQAGGKSGRLEFFARAGWEHTVIFWSEDAGNIRIGHFDATEIETLRRQMGDKS